MKHGLLLSASLAILIASACGNTVVMGTGRASGSTSSGPSSTGTGAGVPSDVTGTVITRYHSEGTPVDQPVDLSGAKVEAYVWGGSAWITYPGTGTASGTFTVPGVPEGLFMLRVDGSIYDVYTTAHQLDLGTDLPGRPNPVYGEQVHTVGGVVANLEPWQSTDVVEWFNPNGNGEADAFSGTEPTAGATSLNDEPSIWFGQLIDSSQGDVLYAMQRSPKTAGGIPYSTVTRFASFPGVQQEDGPPTDVSGAFTDVSTTTVGVDFRASQFAAQRAAVNPGAVGQGATFDVATCPAAAQLEGIGFTADLLPVDNLGEADVDMGLLDYGNPFPAAWGAIASAGETFSVSYTAPGASGSATLYGAVSVVVQAAQVAGPIVPLVSPVQQVLVDGKPAVGTLSGISLTPALSWSPPAMGTPNAYVVAVSEVLPGEDGGSFAWIITTTTSVRVPPNLLQSGHAYVFTITAQITPFDVATHPNRQGTPRASADLLTGLVLP